MFKNSCSLHDQIIMSNGKGVTFRNEHVNNIYQTLHNLLAPLSILFWFSCWPVTAHS